METKKEKIGREEFEKLVKFSLSPSDFRKVMLAYRLSKYGHRNQMRETGERYFEHPKAVALILIQELKLQDRADLIATALMHDLQEDTFLLEWDDIEFIFGAGIVRAVRALTKEEGKPYHEQLESSPADVLMVKLSDRLHNLRTLGGCTDKKKQKQLTETREKYIPLIDKLGAKLSAGDQWRAAYFKKQIGEICDTLEKEIKKA